MHIQHVITKSAAIVSVILIAGCSKSSSPQPQATTPINAAAATAFTTNTSDALQTKYQENEKQILEVQTKMSLLRKTYTITDQPYLDEQAKLNQMLSLQKMLAAEIQALKHP